MEVVSLHLSLIDILIILFSLAIVLAISFYYARFSAKGAENYFLGGRNLPGWANGISYASTALNSDAAPAYCGMMAATGLFIASPDMTYCDELGRLRPASALWQSLGLKEPPRNPLKIGNGEGERKGHSQCYHMDIKQKHKRLDAG